STGKHPGEVALALIQASVADAALPSLAAGYAGPPIHRVRRSGRLGADARSRSAASAVDASSLRESLLVSRDREAQATSATVDSARSRASVTQSAFAWARAWPWKAA